MDDSAIKAHPFYKYADVMREIGEPLFSNTPIHYFYFAKIYHNGNYTGFFSNPEWADFYLRNDLAELGINQLFAYEKMGHFFWNSSDAYPNIQKAKLLLEGALHFSLGCGGGLIKRHSNYNEIFMVCTHHDPHSNDPYLIEHIDLLKKFYFYLKEKIHDDKTLSKAFITLNKNRMIKNSYNIPEKTQPNFSIKRYYISGESGEICLSKREVECLKYTLDGKTAKEIARILKLSPRTIESHIQKIKMKTLSKTVIELRKKLEHYPFLDGLTTLPP